MNKLYPSTCRLALAGVVIEMFYSTGWAIDPTGLQALITRGDKITIIDVRSSTLFQRDHIPSAINVPASLVPEKSLPALGRVVVCDEGLGRDSAAILAAEALNKKSGLTAEVLEGGFAAWQAFLGMSTKGAGVHPEEITLIAYDQLKKANPEELILVDLRKPRPQVRQDASTNDVALRPLTDLGQEFPQSRVTKSAFTVPQTRQSAAGGSARPVLVLIDDGDGSAQATARTLRANGITRVVILVGGESILSRHGQPGLRRIGSTGSPTINQPGSK